MNDQYAELRKNARPSGPDQARGVLATVRRSVRFGAGLLRTVAGAPAGVERSRRGSFLVLVVATLALMSVFAVVYVTIGKTDAGTRRGVVKNESRDDVPNQLADHVAQVLSDDVFATINLGVDNKGDPLNIREVTDFPGVNWTDRSDSTDPKDSFNPAGTFTGQWTGAGSDPRGASDPFLAASEPTFLGYLDDGTKRIPFRNYRDWASISNVAPDGRFVNLYNLRFHGFDADPKQMQEKMTLLDDEGKPTKQLDFGGVLDSNIIPAQLTNRQRGLFRPANTFLKGDPTGQSPNDAYYLDYHFADTDADGFYDARWFELVDAHDLSNIKNLLKTDDGMRYFFAVRIEDLSGRANVLTAMDQVGAPTQDPKNTIGLAPEVDLRRLLSLVDPMSDEPNDKDLKLGYGALQQPDLSVDPQAKLVENYSKYLPGFTGAMSMKVGEQAYHALHNTDATREPLGALHTAIIAPASNKLSPASAFTYAVPGDRADLYNEQLGLGRGVANKSGVSVGAISSIEDLAELLTYRGINDPTVTSQLELIFGGRFRNKLPAQDSDRETVRFSPLRDNRPLSLERDADNIDAVAKKIVPDGVADTDAMIRSAFDVRQRLTTLSGARPIMPTRVTVPMSQDQISAADLPREIALDTNSLYGIYADALIPDSAMDLAWKNDTTLAQFNAVRFTNYGAASAELGARIAGHMAVNLRAAMAGKSFTSPIAYTLLLDEKFRDDLAKDWQVEADQLAKQVSSRNEPWAWWVERGSSSGALTGPLDIGINWRESGNATRRKDSRLGDTDAAFGGDKLESRAINVYGITPQPVLTAAAAFYVFTDIPTKATAAPYGFSGDQEWDGTGEDGDPYKPKHITIDPTVSEPNDDFLMQVVAFQLSNPFDATIYLTQGGKAEGAAVPDDRFEYYIEFAGRYFRLANLNASSSGVTAATLAPGETRVFYTMCLPLESSSGGSDIVSRWNKTKQTFTADQLRTWIDKQMSVTLSSGVKPPTLVEEYNPKDAKRKASTGYVDLAQLPSSGGLSPDPTIASVRLWRALRTASNSTGPLNESPKDWQNDPMPTPQLIENDQLIDRLRDPKFDAGTPGSSSFLPHLDLTGSNKAEVPGTDGGPDNVASEDPLDNTGFSITRFGVVRRNADPDAGTFDPRYDGVPAYMIEGKWANSFKNVVLAGPATVSKGTFDGAGNGHGFDKIMKLWTKESTVPVLADQELTTEPRQWSKRVIGPNKSKRNYTDIRTSVLSELNSDAVRVADMLLPLGVGPEYDNAPAKFDDKYLTLGEALANAMDYSSPPAPSLYLGMGTIPPSSQTNVVSEFPTLDRGHLALDRFVPFYDGNNDKIYDRTQPLDKMRGQGVPAALTIFDRAETIRSDKVAWGIDRPIIGRINVNTASRTVLRSVGVLSPHPSSGEWWWTGSNLDQRSDIATTLVAYRDKLIAWPRDSSPTPNGTGIDFRDNDGNRVPPDAFDKLNGRYNAVGAEAIREAPGFATVGELMLARSLDPSQPLDKNPWRNSPNNIDFMGYNKAIDFHEGVSAGTDPSTKAKDSFEERLQVAASAASALTTRSDFFAVWFIVRGYRESDVKGLTNTDPMVPSVQRRFVMVVDRSNVVKYGQKPRILLLKEVPF
ncbi:MAG: hypothetical protein U0638_17345 [Phycisphaerales bacterium]